MFQQNPRKRLSTTNSCLTLTNSQQNTLTDDDRAGLPHAHGWNTLILSSRLNKKGFCSEKRDLLRKILFFFFLNVLLANPY